MAIRKREGRAKPWQVYWNNPFTGKRETISFETKEEAEKEDSLVKHRLKFERESFRHCNEAEDRGAKAITLEAVYMKYLEEKQFSGRNLAAHISSMRPILENIGGEDIKNLDRYKLEQVRELMLASTRTTATAKSRLSILRTVLRWASDKGYCVMPTFPKMPHVQYEKLVPPTPAELTAIMEVAPAHIQRVIIIGSQCGTRVGPSELLQLTWDDVDLETGILRVHGAKKNLTAPWREVPIRQSLLPVFGAWQKADIAQGIQYLINYKGKQVQTIKKAWATALINAGITRRIRPYDLRHAFATQLIAAGADIGTVAKLMGHSGPAMLLAHYQFVMDKQKRDAVEALPQLEHVPNSMCPNKKGATDLR